MNLGQRVAMIISDSDLSQKDFADRLGLSTSTVSRIVNNQQDLNRTAKHLICETFNVNPVWLETGEGEPYRKKDLTGIIEALVDVLSDNPAILRALSVAAERMTASDWKKINAFLDSLGGAL